MQHAELLPEMGLTALAIADTRAMVNPLCGLSNYETLQMQQSLHPTAAILASGPALSMTRAYARAGKAGA
ncbi:MAG: hypothetical protein ACREV8_09095, partial [Gammaproteobacteria bacterium]